MRLLSHHLAITAIGRRLKNVQLCLLKFVCEEKCRLCGATLSHETNLDCESGTAGLLPMAQVKKGRSNSIMDTADTMCNACWSSLTEQGCLVAVCPLGENILLPVASGAPYAHQMKKLICRFKDNSDRLLSRDFAKLMSRAAHALIELIEEELSPILVPVPLHRWRKLKRGFNQSELLAKEVGKILGWPTDCRALVRVKSTPCQKQLTKTERLANLQGAFKGNRARLSGKDIVLVDDVSTSGATLAECAIEVVNCGASRVFGLTAAKALLYRHKGL